MAIDREEVRKKITGYRSRLIIGDRGSGKTALLYRLAKHRKNPVRILPKPAGEKRRKLTGFEVMTPEELTGVIKSSSRKALTGKSLILDELRVLANPRTRQRNIRATELSRVIALARHLDLRIAMATQVPGGVDRALRIRSDVRVIKKTGVLRRAFEKQKPTRLIDLRKAGLQAGVDITGLRPDEAIVVTDRHIRHVAGIPLPEGRSEKISRYRV